MALQPGVDESTGEIIYNSRNSNGLIARISASITASYLQQQKFKWPYSPKKPCRVGSHLQQQKFKWPYSQDSELKVGHLSTIVEIQMALQPTNEHVFWAAIYNSRNSNGLIARMSISVILMIYNSRNSNGLIAIIMLVCGNNDLQQQKFKWPYSLSLGKTLLGDLQQQKFKWPYSP